MLFTIRSRILWTFHRDRDEFCLKVNSSFQIRSKHRTEPTTNQSNFTNPNKGLKLLFNINEETCSNIYSFPVDSRGDEPLLEKKREKSPFSAHILTFILNFRQFSAPMLNLEHNFDFRSEFQTFFSTHAQFRA
jgi:hypothetical protein